MNTKKVKVLATLMLLLLSGAFCVTGVGFSAEPTFTDPTGDHTYAPADSEDIIKCWVDNNITHILFKLEVVGSWDFMNSWLWIWISINDATGSNWSDRIDILADYCLFLDQVMDGTLFLGFWDLSDGTPDYITEGANDIKDLAGTGMGYFAFSNSNRTVEVGYKLQSSSGGKGYLDATGGQTIKIKFKTGTDSDYAPDWNQTGFSYTLQGGDYTLLVVLIILFPVIGVALGLFLYYRRRDLL